MSYEKGKAFNYDGTVYLIYEQKKNSEDKEYICMRIDYSGKRSLSMSSTNTDFSRINPNCKEMTYSEFVEFSSNFFKVLRDLCGE